jgi:hypothetical protein
MTLKKLQEAARKSKLGKKAWRTEKMVRDARCIHIT